MHLYGTQGDGKNIQQLSSTDLVHWAAGPDALPEVGRWASAGATWAPEVITVGTWYLLYYVAHDDSSGRQCIGLAESRTPQGPFRDQRDSPLVCQSELGGSIDPDPIRTPSGALYLYWKNDGNCCSLPVHLWGQRLSADGRSFIGTGHELLTNTLSWQGNLVEAPEMVPRDGHFVLFYSANDYASAHYGIGYATCTGPLGPCSDRSVQPLVGTTDAAAGPGHCFVLTRADGSTLMFLHAWPPNAVGSTYPGRQLWIEPVSWDGLTPSVAPLS